MSVEDLSGNYMYHSLSVFNLVNMSVLFISSGPLWSLSLFYFILFFFLTFIWGLIGRNKLVWSSILDTSAVFSFASIYFKIYL